ncbi:MAG: RCC1 domain-containing protein [Spirochaetia bacterium]
MGVNNFEASDGTYTDHIELVWEEDKTSTVDPFEYHIYRASVGIDFTEAELIGTTSENLFRDNAIEIGRVYQYYLLPVTKAYQGIPEKDHGYAGSVDTGIQNISTSIGSIEGAVEITWDPIAGARRYYISRREDPQQDWRFISEQTICKYFDTQTVTGRVYEYCIAPAFSEGLGQFSSPQQGYNMLGTTSAPYIDAAAGDGFSLLVDSTGSIFATGNNNFSQTGLTDSIGYDQWTNTGLTGICDVDAGNQHAIALDSSGNVYITGGNYFGQLGNGSYQNIQGWTETALPETVTAVFTDFYRSFAADSEGRLWACGNNDTYQINNSEDEHILTWTEVLTLSQGVIEQVIINEDRTIAVTSTGDAYSSGVEGWVNIPISQTVSQAAEGNGIALFLLSSGEVCYENGDQLTIQGLTPPVQSLFSHNNRIFILDANNTCFVSGENIHYQSGHNLYGFENTGWQITLLPQECVIYASSVGEYHTLLLSQEHGVFYFGRGTEGEFGEWTETNTKVQQGILGR